MPGRDVEKHPHGVLEVWVGVARVSVDGSAATFDIAMTGFRQS